jgi:hypothetical protein
VTVARPAPATLRALGLFALLAVAATWPLAARLHVMDPGDSAFFAWQIAWELHALLDDPSQLPHANACHPLRYALGLDEPVLATAVLALPLRLFTDDAVLLFGLVRLMTWWLSAFTAFLLLRELRCGEPAALLGGALFACSPVRVDQVAHLSTLGTQWLPLVPLFLLRFARDGRWRDALLAGATFALTSYACGYHGLLGLLVLPVPVALLLGRRAALWPCAAAGALLAAALLLPLRGLHRAALEPFDYARGAGETRTWSASLETFLATSPWNRIYGDVTRPLRGAANNLFPGLVPVALPLAAWISLRRRGERASREARFFAGLAAAGVLVSLGPEVRAGGETLMTSPLALVRDALPLFADVRAYARAGIFTALGLTVLAGLAFERLRLRPRVATSVAALALLETLIVPVPLARWARVIDTREPPPPVYAWLAARPAGTAIVELPLLPGDMLFRRPAFHESVYLVRSTLHWQRLANCAAGFETPGYARLRESLRDFPSRAALDELRASGVRYVIVHGRGFGPNQWTRLHTSLPAFASELAEAARFGDDWVFELRQR